MGLISILKNGKAVRSVKQVDINDDLIIRLSDGIIKTKVTGKNG
jgi:ribosomal 50S subunit-recycling heat shock protein